MSDQKCLFQLDAAAVLAADGNEPALIVTPTRVLCANDADLHDNRASYLFGKIKNAPLVCRMCVPNTCRTHAANTL